MGLKKVWRGLCNVCRWAPVIWDDVDWDWDCLAKVMEFKLRRMSVCLENGHHTNGWRDAKQCLVCAELLKRLQEDNYFENAGFREGFNDLPTDIQWSACVKADAMQRQDQEYLGKMIGKHLTGWWD